MARMRSFSGPRRKYMLALTDIGGDGAMGQIDTLGLAGRAAGILQRCEFVRIRCRMRKLPLRLVPPTGQSFRVGTNNNNPQCRSIDACGNARRVRR